VRKDAEAALDRWPGWTPSIAINRPGRFLYRGTWTGPMGGRYVYRSLTKRGIERHVERELARWTRVWRRAGQTSFLDVLGHAYHSFNWWTL
jgi:hypothetical protein